MAWDFLLQSMVNREMKIITFGYIYFHQLSQFLCYIWEDSLSVLVGNMRIRESFGKCHFNPGNKNILPTEKYVLDKTRRFYLFDIIPMGAVRMSSSDRWKTNPHHVDPDKRQRQYFNYKDTLVKQGLLLKFNLQKTLDVVFILPMPASWSEKKRIRMNALPCEVKPDTDNMVKAVCDAFKKNDSDIWLKHAQKRWGYAGAIIIFE